MSNRGWTAFALVALSAAYGCARDQPSQADVPPQGRVVRRLTVDGIERELVLHVPSKVDGTRRVPAVFMLHGTSGSGDRLYGISGWVEMAESEGLIAVFPSALSYCLGEDDDSDGVIEASEYKVTTKWAGGTLGTPSMPLCTDAQIAALPAARQQEIQSRRVRDELAFFDAMVALLSSELPVDPKRIYVTGFSNGGQMSGRLMMERSRAFAAFAFAGGIPVVPGPAERPAPAFFSVGSKDDRFIDALGLPELPLDATLLNIAPVQTFITRVAAALQLDSSQYVSAATAVRGKTVSTLTYARSLAGADNQLVVAVVDDAAHEYPNGQNHPVVMADLLWPFFQRYALP